MPSTELYTEYMYVKDNKFTQIMKLRPCYTNFYQWKLHRMNDYMTWSVILFNLRHALLRCNVPFDFIISKKAILFAPVVTSVVVSICVYCLKGYLMRWTVCTILTQYSILCDFIIFETKKNQKNQPQMSCKNRPFWKPTHAPPMSHSLFEWDLNIFVWVVKFCKPHPTPLSTLSAT